MPSTRWLIPWRIALAALPGFVLVAYLAPHVGGWLGALLAGLGCLVMPVSEHLASWHAARRSLEQTQAQEVQLEIFRQELASTTTPLAATQLLLNHVAAVTGARAVSVRFRIEHAPGPLPPEPAKEPDASVPLGVRDRDLGDVVLWGRIRGGTILRHALSQGAIAIQSMLLAEQLASADGRVASAEAQRDLQQRLSATVSTRITRSLAESQELLAVMRRRVAVMPADRLEADLRLVSNCLGELEEFVHQHLQGAVQSPRGASLPISLVEATIPERRQP